MHIPDGYLSPSTCACLYGASTPFWYFSLKRIKASLSTRSVPLLSVFSAFSFVIMMFNLPLPGGTTGHAVGMGVAAIVLGPAVSILAISIALLIQALFFGDGGVTAFGANCFNMAIVGSVAAFVIYRIISWKADLGSARRVWAAGLAGYGAINLAALCAAIEFGIQPLYFHDSSGTPLYAPYPLSISIPAMMIGHLTLAGFAEFIISSGLVKYLQHSDPEMLRLTAPDAPHSEAWGSAPAKTKTSRALWAGLALLLLLTPLGIVAVGSAWGEWNPEDFGNPAARNEIAMASNHREAPAQAPKGMQRLYSLWKAPLPEYAPGFIPNASIGYLLSAVAGVCLIVLVGYSLRRTLSRTHSRRSFLESNVRHLTAALQNALFAEETADSGGLLQSLDPRVKLAGFAALLLVTVSVHTLPILFSILVVSTAAASFSYISVPTLLTRVWVAVLLFTGVIALPAIVLTPGDIIYRIPWLQWAITAQGLRGAAFLILRAETTATLALVLVASTLWIQLLRALRWFRIPSTAVVLVAMTYRYIFVFLQTAQNMFESRRTKLVGRMSSFTQRRLATASAGVLLDKSIQLSAEVHMAMQARGFRGEVHVLEDLQMQLRDWLQLAGVLLISLAVLLLGR